MQHLRFGLALCFACATLAFAGPSGKYPEKTLYATKDLRGHQAPKVIVATWLTSQPPAGTHKWKLVDMWATWCPPCLALIPELNSWSEKYKNKLEIIGVSTEDADPVKNYMAAKPIKYFVGVDPKARLEEKVGVQGVPHVLLIDPNGIVQWQGYPLGKKDPLTEKRLRELIGA